jgi:hypothetical protein
VRKVLSGLCLLVLCCSLASAQPGKGAGKGARQVARPAASKVQPSRIQKIWKQLTGWVRTYDDPPPPPERGNSPVPG